MCHSATSTLAADPGASDDPVIYSMPDTRFQDLRAAVMVDDPDADGASVSFTDNGSLYLSAFKHNVGASNEVESGTASVIGVSGVDGAQTGVNVEDVTMSADKRQLSMVFRMYAPRNASVRFLFDVNANAVVLRSATPVDETGRPVADAAALGLDFSTIWCVTKNGGAAILPALVKALPSLIGGPGAFLTAVLAALPGAAITTAQSVIANCFS
jgi:hypothetical protein